MMRDYVICFLVYLTPVISHFLYVCPGIWLLSVLELASPPVPIKVSRLSLFGGVWRRFSYYVPNSFLSSSNFLVVCVFIDRMFLLNLTVDFKNSSKACLMNVWTLLIEIFFHSPDSTDFSTEPTAHHDLWFINRPVLLLCAWCTTTGK